MSRTYLVQYWNEHTESWCETYSPVSPIKHKSEAERLAKVRSAKGIGRVYRIRKDRRTVGQYKGGQELGEEKWI